MDTVDPMRFVLAFVFVLGLIGCMAFVLKRFSKGKLVSGGEGARISVVETRLIDTKRRLVLIRRDNKEHLLLIAGDRELLIESDIDAVIKNETQATNA